MRTKRILTALLLAFVWAFVAQADTTFKGVSVDYGNANASLVDGELVLQYKTAGPSSLTISGGAVKADVLVVGGGGGGGGARRQSSGTRNRYGAGGDGGSVRLFENQVLLEGMSYDVTVGAGGTAGIGSSQTAGGKGWASSFGDLEEQSGGKGGSANVTTSTPGKGASGSGTEGVTNSISGSSVKYGEGGMSGGGGGTDNQGNGGGGAAQTDSVTITKNGAAGGSGVVIVRMTKAIPGKLVDNLAITETIVAGADGTFSPIASVPEGVTLTGETSASDIGHYQFVASLKPGYVWRDGLVSTPRIYSWSVVEKAEDARTWINVTKAVHTDPNDPSNAWIAVRGMLPQQQYVPNVLFLGTECNAHSLTAKNLKDAIEAIATVANIDWHIFKSTTASGDSNKDIDRSGTMLKGDKFASKGYADLILDNNNHHAARRFYETLDAVRLDAARSNKYDFIILEFDGSRLADQYTQGSESRDDQIGPYVNEAKVAEFLKPYYARERIFWMVDNHAANSGQSGTVEPWDDGYYRPNTYFHNNYNNILTDAEYKGLIGLLDPEHYDPDATTAAQLAETSRGWQPALCKCTINKRSYEWYDKGTGGNGKRTIYANRRYSLQVFYDDGDTLKENLRDFINAKYRLLFLDKIVEDLEVVSAKFYRSFSTEDGKTMWDDSDGWELVAEQEAGSDPVYYDTSGNASISIVGQEVSSSLSNLNSAVWGKMEIHVRDSESFKDGVVPEYDEASGKWIGKKSPNNGVAMVTRYDKTGAVEASGKASTGIFWEYPAYTVEGVVTNGTLWIDGVETNETHKIEGSDCSVTYRGDPGYALESITVDGTPLTADEIDEHLSDYGFTNIMADHEVVVVYTNFVVTSDPYTNYYDGAEHTIGVQLPDYHDDITDVKVQYSTDGETYVDTPPVYSNAGHAVVHYKVVGRQAGYGDEEITLATGFDTVDILPREVNVTAKSARKFYDGAELTAGYEVQHDYPDDKRAEGWGFVGTDDITTIKMTGESVIGADAAKTEKKTVGNVIDPDQTRFTSDEIAGNYKVNYHDGELEVIPVEVKPVVKIYDGAPTNVEVTVTDAPAGTTVRYSYAEDGGYAEAGELTFTGPTNVWESAVEIWVEVSAPGYGAVTNKASATILPRVVVEQAGSDTKAYDGERLVCSNATERADLEAAKAAEVYEARGYTADFPEIDPADAAGFAEGEGFVAAADGNTYLRMTDDSWRLDVGEADNVIVATEEAIAFELDDGTSCGNYLFFFENGLLEVTPAAFTASSEPVEKFYDSTPTNIIVTVAGVPAGVTPTYEYSYSGTEGFVPAADFTGPTNVSETATVYCRVIIPGTTNVVSATATIKPRIVVSHAKDGEWTFNGAEHKQPDSFEDEDAEAERSKAKWGTDEVLPGSTGFVDGEGYAADLVMTDASRITNPGTKPNVIDTAADKTALKPNTKAENYELYYLDGTLTVTPATFTASAEPVEKFYDSTPTNIIVTVAGVPAGVTPTYEYSYSGTEGFVPAADFTGPTNVLETAEVYCRVIIPGTTNVVSATATIKPRIVVSHAKNGEWTFNGQEHKQPDSFEDEDAEAERSKAKWGTDEVLPGSTGFVDGEGYAADLVMTDASRITNPGTKPNVIDTAADKTALKPNTKAGNYEFHYLNGSLTVTAAEMGIEAFDAEKFYDAEGTNITYVVTNAQGVAITPDKVYLREKNTEPWIPVADFVPYVDTTNVTVEVKAEKSGFDSVEAEATITILPRVVVQKAGDASKDFDGTPLRCDDSDEKPERELEEAERIYGEDGADAIGFVSGEGFATVPMTVDSEQTELGTHTNLIDKGAVTLAEGTKPDNYVFFFDPGTLTVIQRQEEVRRDPDVEIPEESKEAVEKSDKEIEKALDEMAEADQEATGEPYVKYQLTVTPTNHLDETTRTTPEKAAEDAKKQIELAESVTGSKIDKAEFVDIVLERTYSKEEAESTAAGDYHKDNWDPLDKAGEHGNTLFEVVIPVEVPEGMELAGVTRSCDSKGTEILKPRDSNNPNPEGFVYDPETKTVTLYAKDFCVFGFLMKEKSSCPCISCAYVYRVKLAGKTVKGRLLAGKTSCDATTCWAKPASLRIAGYVYGSGDETGSACEPCSCNDWSEGATAMCHYWDADKKQVFADVTTFSFDLFEVLRNNGARNKAQVFWRLGGLQLAGFGVFNSATRKLKNASGFFAGALAAPTCSNWNAATCSEDEPTPAYVFTPCTLEKQASEGAVSYGRWSMTYKADKVRQAEESGTWNCLYPSGWQPTEEK